MVEGRREEEHEPVAPPYQVFLCKKNDAVLANPFRQTPAMPRSLARHPPGAEQIGTLVRP
jgi:hypothetical protein